MKVSQRNRRLGAIAAASLAVAGASTVHAAPSVWNGGDGSWSSNAATGWNGTGVPNLQGAIASKTDTTSATITQNTGAAVTIGTFTLSGGGTSNATTLTASTTQAIVMDQDGAGAGVATISNTTNTTGVNTTRVTISGTGGISLSDNLLISNSSNSANSSAISISAIISGSKNVTINSVSNNFSAGTISNGAVSLTGANSFIGNLTVERGAVSFSASTGLGNTGNTVYLGSSGNSTTLINTGTNTTQNAFVVNATSGTNVLGSSSTAGATNTIFSGNIQLDGNLSVSSIKTSTADVRFTGAISSTGGLTTIGTGKVQLGNSSTSITNTYHGNTTISGSGLFVLSDNARLTFYIGATNVNNQIATTADQAMTLDGDFIFDLTSAVTSGSWEIVDYGALAPTFSPSFSVIGFTESANVWTKTVGTTTYTFSEATGVLTAVPEPSTFALSALGVASLVRRRRR